MKNFSFKKFVKNKDLNEVGQYVFPDKDHIDPKFKDNSNEVFNISNDGNVINVKFTEFFEYKITRSIRELNDDSEQQKNFIRLPMMKQMLAAAGKIIVDHHDKTKIISFKPVFDYLQDPDYEKDKKDADLQKTRQFLQKQDDDRIAHHAYFNKLDLTQPSMDYSGYGSRSKYKSPIIYTMLDKGFKTVIREASKKINEGKNKSNMYTLEKSGHDIHISKGNQKSSTKGNTDAYDAAVNDQEKSNQDRRSKDAKMYSKYGSEKSWLTPEFVQKINDSIEKVHKLFRNNVITTGEHQDMVRDLLFWRSKVYSRDPNQGRKKEFDDLMNHINSFPSPAKQAPAKKGWLGKLFGGK